VAHPAVCPGEPEDLSTSEDPLEIVDGRADVGVEEIGSHTLDHVGNGTSGSLTAKTGSAGSHISANMMALRT